MALFRFSPFRRSLPKRRAAPPPQLEQLEDRLAPAIIAVTVPVDDITPNDGSVSLREAITAINTGNNLGDPDIIAQNPAMFGSNDLITFRTQQIYPPFVRKPLFEIDVGSDSSAANIPLPALTKPVTIDGTTQTGFFGPPIIIVNGLQAGTGANGFDIQLGAQPVSAGVTLKGLVINQFNANGILIEADNVTGFATTASTIPVTTSAPTPTARPPWAISRTASSSTPRTATPQVWPRPTTSSATTLSQVTTKTAS